MPNSPTIPTENSNHHSNYNQNHNQVLNRNHKVNVFCAGDDDQSIYSWRGAQVELMRRFRFDFPGSRVLRFDTSYRLSEPLCQAASSVVQVRTSKSESSLSQVSVKSQSSLSQVSV